VLAARAYLEARPDERVTLSELARAVGASPAHLQRTFKAELGVSPRVYQAGLRMTQLKTRLKQGRPVTAALYEAGYGSSSRLYEQADSELGMTPGAYRRGGSGVRIAFATTSTRVGRLLVAATARGVCSVAFGDSAAALEAGLRREYPKAEIEPGGTELRAWVAAVRDVLNGLPAGDVPLDVPGTVFQQRVWRALQEIPPGAVRSYGQIAQALGRPSAVRAVARACASNHVALLVPCHRVVRADGTAGGYRWGQGRKQRLLDQERERARRTA
jgi:AraC family transcriptional regulator of adaptative response/methylated-DNA-[protein]-cysteine methyltransferase